MLCYDGLINGYTFLFVLVKLKYLHTVNQDVWERMTSLDIEDTPDIVKSFQAVYWGRISSQPHGMLHRDLLHFDKIH